MLFNYLLISYLCSDNIKALSNLQEFVIIHFTFIYINTYIYIYNIYIYINIYITHIQNIDR